MNNLAVVTEIAPSQRSRPPLDLRGTVAQLRKQHRRADEDALAEMLATTIMEDSGLLKEVCLFAVTKLSAALDAEIAKLLRPDA
jgi:hypothetical protein